MSWLILLLVGCPRHPAPPTPAADNRVALIEWQFPTSPTDIVASPSQARIAEDHPELRPALFPQMSEQNAQDPDYARERLERHARNVALSYRIGREELEAPFLLNISVATPEALRAAIDLGVRTVGISSGSKTELGGLDAVVAAHPEVLFIVATPHISGNDISVEEFAERPSVLASAERDNVLLTGCLEYDADNLAAAASGVAVGARENPFAINNQPAKGPQWFMVTCGSAGAFATGAGGTSSAAPTLVALAEIARGRLGHPATAAEVLAAMRAVTHPGYAREKTGEVHEVRYFTLDTVLLNAGLPLVTDRIWWVPDPPDPLRLP